MSMGTALPALEYNLWFLLESEVEKNRIYCCHFRCYKVTSYNLGRFYTKFGFYCFTKWVLFSVNKTAGDTPLIIDVNGLLLFATVV